MELEVVKKIVDEIKSSGVKEFDSHFFIRALIIKDAAFYGQMLVNYKNVNTAHRVISNFLKNNKNELGLELIGKSKSKTILGEESVCKKWEILK